jgi:hypothetical protein
MSFPSRDDLVRKWLAAPSPLPDDYLTPPFDPESAIRAAAEMEAADARLPRTRRVYPCFRHFSIRPGMTPAEAIFWLRVAAETKFDYLQDTRYEFRCAEALARYPEPTPPQAEIERLVVQAVGLARDAVAPWLLPLIGLRQLIEWHLSGKLYELKAEGRCSDFHVLEWHGHRLPSLVKRSEWVSSLRALDEHLDTSDWFIPKDSPWGRRSVRPAWRLAVYVGHTEAVKRLVESWPDDTWESPEWLEDRGTFFVLGARDPDFTLRHFPRLGLKLEYSNEIGAYLVQTGDRMLAPAIESARRSPTKAEAETCVSHLGEVATDLAIRQLIVLAESTGPLQAPSRSWLEDRGPEVIPACARLLSAIESRNIAADHLRLCWRGAWRKTVENLSSPQSQPLLADLVESWKTELANELPPAAWPVRPNLPEGQDAIPGWLKPERMPAPLLGTRRLSDAAIRELLAAFRAKEKNEAFIRWTREELAPDSRDKFWQSLLAEWTLAGTGKKDDWCMDVVVGLRTPVTAANLAKLIMLWPTQSMHHKATLGLEALRAMGDAPALQALVGVAQRTRLAGLRSRAEAAVNEIAAELGLTPEELADTSVPACGLDQDGHLKLDFGPRHFIAKITIGGSLRLLDTEGRPLKGMPKPAASDDAARAAEATQAWKTLKKSVADTVKLQTQRLEAAMITGRSWSQLGFDRYIAAHPVMRSLARTLAWGEFDEEGRLLSSFSIDEKGRAVSAPDGAPFPLSAVRRIGLVHPLHLDAGTLGMWSTWLAKTSVSPAFPQLNRETETPPRSHENEVLLEQFAGKTISGITLRRRLESLGWQRGAALDGGIFYEYALVFPAASVFAILETDGQPVVAAYDDRQLTIRRVFFVSGLYRPVAYAQHAQALPLGLVDTVAYSETVRALWQALRPSPEG